MAFINRFLVGCDPEFVLLGDRVERILDPNGDQVGEEPRGFGILELNDQLEHEGEFGTDHGGFCVEVRPQPQRSTYRLTLNIRHILRKAGELHLPDAKWRAGAYIPDDDDDDNSLPLGGHVHLDVPFDAPETELRVKALDAFTRTAEALDILPRQECELRRGEDNDGYGAYSSVRQADNANRLEYRTMASWLFHPTPTFLCLTGAKLACAEPQKTLDILKGAQPSAEFREFFRTFAPHDGNAQRAVEKIFERQRKLVHNPDIDLRESWKVIPF